MRLLKYLPFLLFVYTSVYSQEGIIKIDRNLETSIRPKKIKIFRSENLIGDRLNIDSREWKVIQLGENAEESINAFDGISWLLLEIEITDSLNFDQELTVNLTNVGLANEIFWDNKRIGKKGSIGRFEEKETGQEVQVIKVPHNDTAPGYHQLLIKTYNDKQKNISHLSSIEIGFYLFFMERRVEQQYIRTFFMAILFASALFSLVLFFGFNRNVEYLFFSLYCFANSRRAYFLPFRMLESFGKTVAIGISSLSAMMYIVASFSLLAYLITKFSLYKTQKVISILFLLMPFIIFIFPMNRVTERIHYELMTILPFIIAFYALFRKKEGSVYILIGLTGLTTLTYLGHRGLLPYGYFVGILFLVVCISILSSKDIATQNRKHREAVLRTARLENELLKRNIQPHFILNTLTSLQELVEQNPKKASKLIQALAEEFQLFSKVSSEKLITISDELKICSAHLRIMEYRKGVKFEFSTQGIEGTEKIPPGIFHTCIENGTTHGYVNKKKGKFTLKKELHEKCTRYIIFNDSESRDIPKEIKKGTGLKYIEARLEESFPRLWKCASYPVENGWEVVIEIVQNKEPAK